MIWINETNQGQSLETLVFDFLCLSLALAQLPGTFFFAEPEAHPIFLRLRFGFSAPAFLAISVEIDDHFRW